MLVAGALGGGQGGLGDLLAQELAIALGLLLLLQGLRGELAWRAPLHVRLLVLLPLSLPLLQLLPLPVFVLQSGAARQQLAAQLSFAGGAWPCSITLDRVATETALWWLLPALAVVLATLTRSRKYQQVMLLFVALLAIANVAFGMLQESGGTGSGWRLYEITNKDRAVGLFANRNHFACLLAMLLPVVIGTTSWALAERLEGRRMNPMAIVAGAILIILLVIGIALSGSRAGLLLAMVAVLGCAPLLVRLNRQKGARRLLYLVIGVALFLTLQFSLLGAVPRLINTGLEDGRWTYARTTVQAIGDYLPLGSGLGTFRNAYQPYEAQGEPTRYIINHAHNDYLELLLEGGVFALVLLAIGAFFWLRRGWELFRHRSDDQSLWPLLVRCCWLGASMGLLHSALDFPLRTTAAMTVFAVFAAIAFSGREEGRPRQEGNGRGSRRRELAKA